MADTTPFDMPPPAIDEFLMGSSLLPR